MEKIIKIAVYKPVSGVTGRVDELDRLVQPLGAQLMAMKPEKRRCLECLGSLVYDTGCGGRRIPSCESCNGSFSRGGDGYYIIMTDEDGVVIGTMDPVVIDGKAYLPPAKEFEFSGDDDWFYPASEAKNPIKVFQDRGEHGTYSIEEITNFINALKIQGSMAVRAAKREGYTMTDAFQGAANELRNAALDEVVREFRFWTAGDIPF
jgi:hypothetical protein